MESGDIPKHYFVPIVSSAACVVGRTDSIEISVGACFNTFNWLVRRWAWSGHT